MCFPFLLINQAKVFVTKILLSFHRIREHHNLDTKHRMKILFRYFLLLLTFEFHDVGDTFFPHKRSRKL